MRQYIDVTQDAAGNALVGVKVAVLTYTGGTNASIYSDNGLTALANPVTSDSTGAFAFYIADGDYTLQFTYNSTVYKTQSPVSIFDGAPQLTVTDTGAANAYATSSSFMEKALRTGLRSTFKAANTNTTTSTYAYNGLAANTIQYEDGTALIAGAIVSGGLYTVEYDGTVWRLNNSTQYPVQTALSSAYIPVSPPVTSGTNTYTATTTPSFAALTNGAIYPVTIGTTNTSGTVTLNLNGIGAKSVVMSDGAAIIPIGMFLSGATVFLYYNGTNFLFISDSDVTGSFTITLTGYASGPTGTVNYRISGNVVYIWIATGINGTSNATTLTGTGIPAVITPITSKKQPCYLEDNTVSTGGWVNTGTSSTWTFGLGFANATSGFTSSGTKGFSAGFAFSYTLD